MAKFFSYPLAGLHTFRKKQAPTGFSSKWYEIRVPLTRLSEEETLCRRKQVSPDLKKAFTKAALASVSRDYAKQVQKQMERWEIHHIIPLSLGGEVNRLAFVSHDRHKEIHERIYKQTKNMLVGETRKIWIPVRSDLLWPLEKNKNKTKPRLKSKKRVSHDVG